MADSPQQPPLRSHGQCPDCGAAYDEASRRNSTANCCDACHAKRLTFVRTPPPDALPEEAPRPWFRTWKIWLLASIVALAGAGFLGRKPLLHTYRHWSKNMHARRAAQAFERKDYAHAILDGTKALEFDPFDAEANRIIAKSHEAQGSPDAIPWRARLNLVLPGDPENAIAWARDTLNVGAIGQSEDALSVLKPADRNIADFHDISAQIAMARGDSAKAESHWIEAIRLAPASEDFRLKLALLQVLSHSEKIRAPAAKTLASLSEIPRHRPAALRALIEDAVNRKEFPLARKFTDDLLAMPGATFTDRLGRLSVLRAQDAPDAPQYLEQLRDASLKDPEQLAALLHWMNQNGLPLLVSDWAPALPPALVSQPPVGLAVADAFGRDHDWPKLNALVEKAVWKDYEHVRLALLSRAQENSGTVVAADTTWDRAIKECQGMPDRLAALVRLAQSWHWDERMELALRKLSTDERTPLWVLDALWAIASKSGDSGELHRLSLLMVKARPRSPIARNNFIRLSLLRRAEDGATNQLAADFFKEAPDDINRAVTYALSLFFQGRVFDAKETLGKFSEPELRQLEPALYYGIFLQASGDSARAEKFLALAQGRPLLRDEEELISRVKRESRFNTLTPPPKQSPGAPK